MKLKTHIGLEIHLTLNTKTKLLSSTSNSISTNNLQANEYASSVDRGVPGTLPHLNKSACCKTALLSKALQCRLNVHSEMSRKHYFYFDMPKGYQVTQTPQYAIGLGGMITGQLKNYLLDHVHLEEDAAKHAFRNNEVLIDYNRAGQPLAEIVTKPVINSAEEALDCIKTVKELALILDVSDCRMELGQLKVDVNISLSHNDELGTKSEIKNLNSFNFIKRAIELEVSRQQAIYNSGKLASSSTLGYDEKQDKLHIMREKASKKHGSDYTYLYDGNLPSFNAEELLDYAHYQNFIQRYQKLKLIPWNQRENISQSPVLFRYFIELIEVLNPDEAYKFVRTELAKLAKTTSLSIRPRDAGILYSNYLSKKFSIEEFRVLLQTQNSDPVEDVQDLVSKLQQKNTQSNTNYEKHVTEVLSEHQEDVKDYQRGNKAVLGYLIGRVKDRITKSNQGPVDGKKLAALVVSMIKTT